MLERAADINEGMTEAALNYLRLGYKPIPLASGTKQAAVKWKRLQTDSPTEGEIRDWFSEGESNVAIVTGNGVVVVDCDCPDIVDLVIAHCGDTPMRTCTPSGGMHLWYGMRQGVHYGNAVKIKDRPIDLRCEGGYAVVPWSRNAAGVPYRWQGSVLPATELPLLKVSWLRERKPRPMTAVEVSSTLDAMVRRARAYLSCIEGAISGQGGHARTFRVACILVVKFGLSVAQAWPLLQEWNLTCEPPWSDKELLHKLEDALNKR